MKRIIQVTGSVVVAVAAARTAAGHPVAYTDEVSFRAALKASGLQEVSEDFEGDAWASVRTSAAGARTSAFVTSQGITWSGLHSVTTGNQVARSGWAVFDHPGGDPDGLRGASPTALYAVGGWFVTNTPFTDLSFVIDGVRADGSTLHIDTQYRFVGVVEPAGFSTFEIIDLESSALDPRHWYADDFVFGIEAQASPRTTGVIPGVASVRGREGSDWHTDVVIHNAGPRDALVSLAFARRGESLDPAVSHQATIGSNRTITLEDVVSSVFGGHGSGSLYWKVLAGDDSSILLSGFTYSRDSGGGRYGEEVPGIRWATLAPPGAAQTAPAAAGRFRTNLGLATDHACTRVALRVFDSGGALRESRELAVRPLAWLQLEDLFARVFPGLVPAGPGATLASSLHRVEVTGVDGQVAAYTSLIDNVSNDASTMLARAVTVPDEGWLASAALLRGLVGSDWHSDLLLVSGGTVDATAGVSFFRSGGAASAEGEFTAGVAANGAAAFEDVLAQAAGLAPPALGSLRVSRLSGSPLLSWLRTYTIETGPGGAERSFGQAVAAVTSDEVVRAGDDARIAGVGQGPTERCNLVLQNVRMDGSGQMLPAKVVVDVFRADGALLATRTYYLLPGEYIQHSGFLSDFKLAPLSSATVRVRLASPLEPGTVGGVIALATVVDGNSVRGTNDGRAIPARVATRQIQ